MLEAKPALCAETMTYFETLFSRLDYYVKNELPDTLLGSFLP